MMGAFDPTAIEVSPDEAQLICQSVLSELLAETGVVKPTEYLGERQWYYSMFGPECLYQYAPSVNERIEA